MSATDDKLKRLVALLDPIVWAAHFQCRLPKEEERLSVSVPVSKQEWGLYWKQTRSECRGYWHGATARVAERLGLITEEDGSDEWDRMVKFHQPEPPTCLGDSSHDYSCLIQNCAVFDEEQTNGD